MTDHAFIRDLNRFLRREWKWWLIPLAAAVLVLGGLLLSSRPTDAAGPFLYPSF